MEKIYDPKVIESKWLDLWKNSDCFIVKGLKNQDKDQKFCMVLPPPNVTGSLHMGHAFQHTIMDVLIRLKRMQGNEVLWQVGLDHAGISTQMVIERQLGSQGIKRTDLSREEFIAKIWQWKEQSGGSIVNQMQRMGNAIDWSIGKFTLDSDFCTAVKKVFVQLYREGLIYKGKKLINWDPSLQTAISDLEVITEEVPGKLWYIKYAIVDSKEHITIATTRPETLLGDVAVGINPEDPRFRHLLGKQAIVPLVGRVIPIIADPYVDQNFGTGCLKITPAHDQNDYNLAIKHNLDCINIFTKDLKLNENVPLKYQGLSKDLAREAIIADLKEKDLLIKVEDWIINIPKSSNTNAIVEPLLTEQWLVKMESLAKPAIAAVNNKQIEFIPSEWTNNYLEWLNNIQDWCISRQLWWGHQIPAWYDAAGNVYVGEDLEEVRTFYNLTADLKLTQDPDVLDTWFSAALWPFVTLGWPNTDAMAFKKFFPTDVLVTGFDIIFFWVARMIMFSLKFTNQVPFKKIYIHGIIQDQDGQKMSKTKGNVLDPIDLVDGISLADLLKKRTTGLMQPQLKDKIIAKTTQQFPHGINSFGTDPLRFTFCALATHNRHIKFELLRLEGYRNFCNKVWNAARFVLSHLGEQSFDLKSLDFNVFKEHPTVNQWILSVWQQVKLEFIQHMDNYRFDLASKSIYDFIWNEYCDWYIELAKVNLLDKDTAIKNQVKLVLVLILDEILKMLHPIMPYITEEIWQAVTKHVKLNSDHNKMFLLEQTYPVCNNNLINIEAIQEFIWVKKIIVAIRTLRANLNIAAGIFLPEVLVEDNLITREKSYLTNNQAEIKALAKIKQITIASDTKEQHNNLAVALVNQTKVWFKIDGLIDIKAEQVRIKKEIDKLQRQLSLTTNKLSNSEFLNNAPKNIVVKEQQQQITLQVTIDKLIENLKQIS